MPWSLGVTSASTKIRKAVVLHDEHDICHMLAGLELVLGPCSVRQDTARWNLSFTSTSKAPAILGMFLKRV